MERVIKISSTIQEFCGERFYLCGAYFQRKGKRLHRAVWEFYNGKIEKGQNIHHINKDVHENNIENLALLNASEHQKHHGKELARKENGKRAIKLAQEAAKNWHKSAEGKAWHSQQGKKTWENIKETTMHCLYCGKEFKTKVPHRAKFCHPNCKAKHYRRRHSEN